MTDNQRPTDSAPLPAPVTGVARGGHGTGTALDDTQPYDVSDFSPVPPAPAAPPPPVDSRRAAPAPLDVAPAVAAPVLAAPVASAGPGTRVPSRTTTGSRTRRVGAPVAGLAGFALAAGLAVLVGAVLGGVPIPDGAAAGGSNAAPTEPAPAPTKATDPDSAGGGGSGDGGNGKGNGKKDDDNGNGRGNGNDD